METPKPGIEDITSQPSGSEAPIDVDKGGGAFAGGPPVTSETDPRVLAEIARLNDARTASHYLRSDKKGAELASQQHGKVPRVGLFNRIKSFFKNFFRGHKSTQQKEVAVNPAPEDKVRQFVIERPQPEAVATQPPTEIVIPDSEPAHVSSSSTSPEPSLAINPKDYGVAEVPPNVTQLPGTNPTGEPILNPTTSPDEGGNVISLPQTVVSTELPQPALQPKVSDQKMA